MLPKASANCANVNGLPLYLEMTAMIDSVSTTMASLFSEVKNISFFSDWLCFVLCLGTVTVNGVVQRSTLKMWSTRRGIGLVIDSMPPMEENARTDKICNVDVALNKAPAKCAIVDVICWLRWQRAGSLDMPVHLLSPSFYVALMLCLFVALKSLHTASTLPNWDVWNVWNVEPKSSYL